MREGVIYYNEETAWVGLSFSSSVGLFYTGIWIVINADQNGILIEDKKRGNSKNGKDFSQRGKNKIGRFHHEREKLDFWYYYFAPLHFFITLCVKENWFWITFDVSVFLYFTVSFFVCLFREEIREINLMKENK